MGFSASIAACGLVGIFCRLVGDLNALAWRVVGVWCENPCSHPIRGYPFPRLRLSRISRVPRERIPARVGTRWNLVPASMSGVFVEPFIAAFDEPPQELVLDFDAGFLPTV